MSRGKQIIAKMIGGEGGIRTLGTLAGTTVFETVLFNHSSTSPQEARQVRRSRTGVEGGADISAGDGLSQACRKR